MKEERKEGMKEGRKDGEVGSAAAANADSHVGRVPGYSDGRVVNLNNGIQWLGIASLASAVN